MSSDAQQQGYYDPDNRGLYASRKRQCRDRCGDEVKRDGNEVGDRNH
jgi:hypothetical protein